MFWWVFVIGSLCSVENFDIIVPVPDWSAVIVSVWKVIYFSGNLLLSGCMQGYVGDLGLKWTRVLGWLGVTDCQLGHGVKLERNYVVS